MTHTSDTTSARSTNRRPAVRQMLNKVPEITVFFWIVKILATTVGETAADFLNVDLNLGLVTTSWVMGLLLIVVLTAQMRVRRYVPTLYWLTVVLISIVGTLVTDNLVDNLGVGLGTTTTVFGVLLVATFAAWFASERTLSIHTVHTTRREGFYWTAILFTFALGTAAGDLLAEGLNAGFAVSAVLFGAAIAAIWVAHVRCGLGAVVSFWAAYILTRPLGASLGDLLSQPRSEGGFGLGTVVTSALFLTTIVGVVAFLTRTRRDVT